MNNIVTSITIIALIGDTRVGKDTFASLFTTQPHNFKRLAFADPIKDVAKILFNFNNEQCNSNAKELLDERWNITPRQFFQQFGTEIMQRDIYKYLPSLETIIPVKHFWSLRLINELESLIINDNINNFVISDVRFTHEIDDLVAFTERFDANNECKCKYKIKLKTIKITRPNVTHASMHTSHSSIDDIPASSIHHHIQNNSSLHEFTSKCIETFNEIMLE
jgi:hypothetical protein